MADSGEFDNHEDSTDDESADIESIDDEQADASSTDDLPSAVLDDAERLTRLARGAVDDAEAAAYREEREALLDEHGYTARLRNADASEDATLVCYPAEWIEDGTVRIDRIEDVDRGRERELGGPGDDDWDGVAAANDAIVEEVAEEYDEPHVSNARALADFASNHYAKPVADLTPAERAEFREEYFPRNAWPSESQERELPATLDIVAEKIEADAGDSPT